MERPRSRSNSYASSNVTDMLKQLHIGSSSPVSYQSRQSSADCKPSQQYNYDFEHERDSSLSKSVSLPRSLSPSYRSPIDQSRLSYNEQSYVKCSNTASSPYYSNLVRPVPLSRDGCSSASGIKYNSIEPLSELSYRRSIIDSARGSPAKENSLFNRKVSNLSQQIKATMPHFSSSKEFLRSSRDRYSSAGYYDPYSIDYESYLEERDSSSNPMYSVYPNTQIDYPSETNSYSRSNKFSRYDPKETPGEDYLYGQSTPIQKSYPATAMYKKRALFDNSKSNEMNGYMFDKLPIGESSLGLEHGMKTPDLLNDPEENEYQYSEYLSSSAFTSKETVEVLGPEEVRWFYKTEGDKKWTPFIGYDSIKIEWAYRELVHKSVTKDKGVHSSYDSGATGYEYLYESQIPQNERPIVCGGLYEVDVSALKAYSIYWQAEEFTIMRGTWFYEGSWMPVESNIAKQIETEHLTQFQGSNLSSNFYDKDSQQGVVHSLTLSEGEVDWFSSCDVFFSHDATPSRLMRSVSKRLGFQKTGYKLHRGYCLDASSDDKPPDITHIVFVIHGIGQKMETGRIIKNCTSLRENIKWLKEKQFPSCDFTNQTVEFFPVEWRSSLTLDSGIIESITPHKIFGLRQMLNASFMDIMYYNSLQYREEIVNGLTAELDRLYTMFTARNPYFEANGGKVSVIAHSLGCVITYDIVTGWCPAPQMSQSFLQALINLTQRNVEAEGESTLNSFQNALQQVLQQQLEKSTQPRLKFKIENFFCLGSPLAVFLGLRRNRQESAPPAPLVSGGSFHRLFNIFHPADPVAYRVEPLVCQKYSAMAPVTIHSYNSTEKLSYDEVPPELISMAPRPTHNRTDLPSDLEMESLASSILPTTPSKGTTAWNFWNFMKQPKKGSDAPFPNKSMEDVDVSEVLKHRIDFVLREGSMESSYLSALTSHTSYWGNMDVAFFLLCTFCPHILDKSS